MKIFFNLFNKLKWKWKLRKFDYGKIVTRYFPGDITDKLKIKANEK